MKTWFIALLMAGSCPAQIGTPQLGFVVDGARSLRPLMGLSGSWVLGDPVVGGVVNAASSGSFSLVKTDTSILVLDGRGNPVSSTDAEPGPAAFSFDGTGRPGLAWVRSAGLLAWRTDHWEGGVVTGGLVGGQVLSLVQLGQDRVRFFTQRDDSFWVVELALANGSLLSQTALPGVAAPALLQADGRLVYTDGTGIVVRDVDGTERRVDLGFIPVEFHPLADGWLLVWDQDSTRFAVRTQAGMERVSQLPEVQPCCGN